MSQKEQTRPPVFDDKAADDRKYRELYGDSGYRPATNQSAKKANGAAVGGDNRYQRKAANLTSNVFAGTEDDATRERNANYDFANTEKMASGGGTNAGWASQTGLKKPMNKGGVDAFRQKQNQNASALTTTDYSAY